MLLAHGEEVPMLAPTSIDMIPSNADTPHPSLLPKGEGESVSNVIPLPKGRGGTAANLDQYERNSSPPGRG